MGNRAMIVAEGASIGIYLHWNGGRDSVEAFLEWAELAQLPKLRADGTGIAQLVTVINNFFGNDGLNVRIEPVDPRRPGRDLDLDNGVYVVDGFTITRRIDAPGREQNTYDRVTMLQSIDAAQPERDQLTAGFITAQERATKDLAVGDRVYIQPARRGGARYLVHTVLGIENGKPYVDKYDGQDNSRNPNSYLNTDTVRVPAE